jgi:NADH:ubiquinone oxidoreductase subunit K
VHCEHFFAIGITGILGITQVVLIVFCAEMMATNPDSLGIVLLATCIGCVI